MSDESKQMDCQTGLGMMPSVLSRCEAGVRPVWKDTAVHKSHVDVFDFNEEKVVRVERDVEQYTHRI